MDAKLTGLVGTAILLFACLTSATSAGEQFVNESKREAELQRHLDQAQAPIQSPEDFSDFVATGTSPLNKLSDAGLKAFREGLIFGENGVASFDKRPLENELTPTEIYRVLELIGFQRAITGFQNARIETEKDLELLTQGSSSRDLGTSGGDCGEYVEGYCFNLGTCKIDDDFCCHPPSCSYETP